MTDKATAWSGAVPNPFPTSTQIQVPQLTNLEICAANLSRRQIAVRTRLETNRVYFVRAQGDRLSRLDDVSVTPEKATFAAPVLAACGFEDKIASRRSGR